MSVKPNDLSPDVKRESNILSGDSQPLKSNNNWQSFTQRNDSLNWRNFQAKNQAEETLGSSCQSNSQSVRTAGVTTEGKVTGKKSSTEHNNHQSQQGVWRVKQQQPAVPQETGKSARPSEEDFPIEKGASDVVQTTKITTTATTTTHHQQKNDTQIPKPKVQSAQGPPNKQSNIANKQQQKVYQPRYANNKQIKAAEKRLEDILKEKDIDDFEDKKVVIRVTTANGSYGLWKQDLIKSNLDIRKAIINCVEREKPKPTVNEIYKDIDLGTDNLELHKSDVDKFAFAEREQKIGDSLKDFRIDGATDTLVDEPRWALIYVTAFVFVCMVLSNLRRIGFISSIIKSIWSFDIITPLVEWIVLALIDTFPQITLLLSLLDLVRFFQTLSFMGFMIEVIVFKLIIKIKVIYNLIYVSKIRRDVVKVHRFTPHSDYGTGRLALNHMSGQRVRELDARTDNQKRSVMNHQPLLVFVKYKVRARLADIIYFNLRDFFYKDWASEYPGGLTLNVLYKAIAIMKRLIYTEKEFWKLENNKWVTRKMLIDAELMSQITAAEVVNHSMDSQLAFDRLVERSKSFSTINLDRYYTLSGQRGEQIVSDTAIVSYAWYMEKCNQHSRSVFPKAPKQ